MPITKPESATRRAVHNFPAAEAVCGALSAIDLAKALNHISQGVCIFDVGAKIVFCNDAYVQRYGLYARVVKRGCTLRSLIEHRRAAGYLVEDVDECVSQILSDVSSGNVVGRIAETRDGKIIKIISHPILGGGRVVIHQDITDRSIAERKV